MDAKGNVEIPQSMVIYDEEKLISIIYGDISRTHTPPPPDYFLEHAILAPKNTDVQETNQKILDRLPGPEIVLHSADSVETDNLSRDAYGHDDIPEDFLHSVELSSLPLSELKVKIGCPLMLLCNLDLSKGLCNGTHFILLRAYTCILEVLIIGGDHHGETAFIPWITLKPTFHDYPFILKRHQFPVRLLSINKAQGQSLKFVGIHLLFPVFCHGQLYVAFSRATSSQHIHVLLPKTSGNKMPNIMYPEILID